MQWAFAAGILIALPQMAAAGELERLAERGYGVLEETSVSGDFEGCDYDKVIKFVNGMFFRCQTYRYHYAYGARVHILANVRRGHDELVVMIDDEEYDGVLFEGR